MRVEKVMRKSLYVNFFLIIVKVLSGIFFNSVALIADGVHSISDLLSDVFVILGIKHSFKPADDDHPFGHGKFEYILSLFLGISIITIAYNLGKSVIENFNKPIEIPSYITLIIVLIVVVVKLLLSRYLIQTGKIMDSEIVYASGRESFTDVISSGVVFIGILFVLIGDWLDIYWLQKGDRIASIIIALFIIKIGIEIIYNAVNSLQGKRVNKIICEPYRKEILDVEGVISIDKLDMIAYGPYYQVVVDIKVDASITVKAGHDIANSVEKRLMNEEKISHVSVHVNPGIKEDQ
jgi:cation diffusion facilitator family transporter